MDAFYDFLSRNYFVDYNNQEVKDMTEAVKCCLEELKRGFNKYEDGGLKISELFPCGSMSEHTTIWLDKHHNLIWRDQQDLGRFPKDYRCIEFDFLAILEPLTADLETVSTCPGHAKISSETLGDELTLEKLRSPKTPKSSDETDSNSSVNSLEFHNLFQEPYKIITWEFYRKLHLVTIKESDNGSYKKEMETGTCILEFNADVSPDAPVLFSWVSKAPTCHRSVIAGKMDFLPAFRTTHSHQETVIVGKHCCSYESCLTCSASSECESNCKEQCWRISQSKEELAYIKNTSKFHRDVYKIIKVFCDKVSRHQYFTTKLFEGSIANTFHLPSSYHMKTALIHHIRNCTNNADCVIECLCQVLLEMKEFSEKGQMLNWKGTFHLGVDTYEICVYIMMNIVFSQVDSNMLTRDQYLIGYLKALELPPVLEDKVFNLMELISKGNPINEDFLRDLTNCLAYPLWDYASCVIKLTDHIISEGRCDILLEPVAKVYGRTVDEHMNVSSNWKNESITKSHSESDLEVLGDYVDEKNFDKNWENIFFRLRMNEYPDSSFTQWIKNEKTQDLVYTIPEQDVLPYGDTEKQDLISIIKDEEDFWFQRMLESFELFCSAIKF